MSKVDLVTGIDLGYSSVRSRRVPWATTIAFSEALGLISLSGCFLSSFLDPLTLVVLGSGFYS